MEANAARQATTAEWSQGAPGPYSQTLTWRIKLHVVIWLIRFIRHRCKGVAEVLLKSCSVSGPVRSTSILTEVDGGAARKQAAYPTPS